MREPRVTDPIVARLSDTEYAAVRRWYRAHRMAVARDNFWWTVVAVSPAVAWSLRTTLVRQSAWPLAALLPACAPCLWLFDAGFGDRWARVRHGANKALAKRLAYDRAREAEQGPTGT